MNPLVSVVILTKDRRFLLEEALNSIRSQDYTTMEILVCNDGSSDGTHEYLTQLSNQDVRVKLVGDAHANLGITERRRQAIESAVGKYVAFLDDDDTWTDTAKLSMQVRFMEEHEKVVIVGGGMEQVNVMGQVISKVFRPIHDPAIRTTMLFRNNFFTSTVMCRLEEVKRVGSFKRDEDDLAEDYDLWLRLGHEGEMYNFPLIFARYRKPDYNKTTFLRFLNKQARLIKAHRAGYPGYFLAHIILRTRIFLNGI